MRGRLHVTDHCRGTALAATGGRAGQVYHIGGDVEQSNIELTGRILAACGRDASSIRHVADRPGHDRSHSLSTAKITAELGYRPLVPFTAGLRDMVAWYRDHPDWWRRDGAS